MLKRFRIFYDYGDFGCDASYCYQTDDASEMDSFIGEHAKTGYVECFDYKTYKFIFRSEDINTEKIDTRFEVI